MKLPSILELVFQDMYIPVSSFPILTAHFITTYSAFIFMPETAQQVAVGPWLPTETFFDF